MTLRAFLTNMALLDTFVSTILHFKAFLSTGALAFSFMANLITEMSAFQFTFTGFATTDFLLETVHIFNDFLSATTRFGHLLSAGRTLIDMALNGTFMSTGSLSSAVFLTFWNFGAAW